MLFKIEIPKLKENLLQCAFSDCGMRKHLHQNLFTHFTHHTFSKFVAGHLTLILFVSTSTCSTIFMLPYLLPLWTHIAQKPLWALGRGFWFIVWVIRRTIRPLNYLMVSAHNTFMMLLSSACSSASVRRDSIPTLYF